MLKIYQYLRVLTNPMWYKNFLLPARKLGVQWKANQMKSEERIGT